MSEDGFKSLTDAFTAWFTSNERREAGTSMGLLADINSSSQQLNSDASNAPIAIADWRSRGRGRAVVATHDIEPETTLFTVSHTDVLSISTSGLRKLLSPEELCALPPWTACVLALIFEHGQGIEGKWWPYLAILPDSFDTLMYWTNEELLELQGSHIVQKIGRVDAEAVFEAQLWPIVRAHASKFGIHAAALSDVDETKAQSYLSKLAHRFATLVMAYAFDLDQEDGEQDLEKSMDEDGFIEETVPPKGMVPYADMLNAEGEEHNNARLFHNENSVSMVATRKIKAGEEVFNDYGSLPNAEVLRCYGYTATAYEPHDIVELQTDKLVALARMNCNFDEDQIQKRLNLANRWDVFDESFDLTRDPGKDQLLDERLLLTVMLLTSDDDQYKDLKQARRPPPAKLNLAMTELLMQAIQQRQKDYPTSLAEDQALLRKDNGELKVPKRRYMAVRVRLGEKEVLAQNLEFLKGWVDNSASRQKATSEDPDAKRRKA